LPVPFNVLSETGPGERCRLQTRIAAMESVLLCARTKS
jgi:hypothetical protein